MLIGLCVTVPLHALSNLTVSVLEILMGEMFVDICQHLDPILSGVVHNPLSMSFWSALTRALNNIITLT